MNHVTGDLLFGVGVLVMLICDKIDLCKLRARIENLEKSTQNANQPKNSTHRPLPFPDEQTND